MPDSRARSLSLISCHSLPHIFRVCALSPSLSLILSHHLSLRDPLSLPLLLIASLSLLLSLLLTRFSWCVRAGEGRRHPAWHAMTAGSRNRSARESQLSPPCPLLFPTTLLHPNEHCTRTTCDDIKILAAAGAGGLTGAESGLLGSSSPRAGAAPLCRCHGAMSARTPAPRRAVRHAPDIRPRVSADTSVAATAAIR